jgi:teichuronic acid biosynthesis glycosyltransferase TuaH
MLKNQNIVCISNTTWYGDYQKPTVILLSRLARSNNVLFVDYAFTIKDLLFGLFGKNKAPLKQILGIKKRLDVIEKYESGKVVKLILPPVLPFNYIKNNFLFRLVLKFNSIIIERSIKRAIKQLHFNEVISMTSFMPFYGLFLKGKLNEKLNVYFCYDPIDGKRNGPRGIKYENE